MFNPKNGKRIHLTHGAGNGVDRACLMTASNMLIGRGQDGDNNSCVCPVIRRFIIATNDSMPESLLGDLYGPLAWEILGTATGDPKIEQQRACKLADWAVRQIAPIALEADGFTKYADSLRALPPIADEQSANAAAGAARAAANATNAAYSTNAAAYAAYAAVRAYNAAANAANAAYTTNAAADAVDAASSAASYTAAYTENVWRMCPEIIREVAAIGDRRPVETVIDRETLADALAN